MKALLATVLFLCSIVSIGYTQDITDIAILVSQSNYGGTARVQGIGGAQVALGGDLSNITSNPAGLGMFNRSVFSGSIGINFLNSKSDYGGQSTQDSKANVNIPNLSIAIHKEIDSRYTDFKSGTFGVSFSRINDFHRQDSYRGQSGSSMLDFFIERADGVDINSLLNDGSLEALAAQTDLIYALNDSIATAPSDLYESAIFGTPTQTESISVKGRQTQLSFSYGANYADILFIGAGIGLTSLDYTSSKTFAERDYQFDDPSYQNPLNEFTLEENLNITGNGVNATLGIMLRPMDFLQLGGSFTTPTYYNIDDEYDASIAADYVSLQDAASQTDIFLTNYSVTTPSRLNGGATLFLGKHGFISADIERVNYAKSRLTSDDFEALSDNEYLKDNHRKAYNWKLGAEYRLDVFRFRAGVASFEHPEVGSKDKTNRITGGIGLRTKDYFVDFTMRHTMKEYDYSPYQLLSGQPIANVDQNSTEALITIGVNF